MDNSEPIGWRDTHNAVHFSSCRDKPQLSGIVAVDGVGKGNTRSLDRIPADIAATRRCKVALQEALCGNTVCASKLCNPRIIMHPYCLQARRLDNQPLRPCKIESYLAQGLFSSIAARPARSQRIDIKRNLTGEIAGSDRGRTRNDPVAGKPHYGVGQKACIEPLRLGHTDTLPQGDKVRIASKCDKRHRIAIQRLTDIDGPASEIRGSDRRSKRSQIAGSNISQGVDPAVERLGLIGGAGRQKSNCRKNCGKLK